MWGRLTWSAIPIDQPIVIGASAVVGIGIVLVLAWITLLLRKSRDNSSHDRPAEII